MHAAITLHHMHEAVGQGGEAAASGFRHALTDLTDCAVDVPSSTRLLLCCCGLDALLLSGLYHHLAASCAHANVAWRRFAGGTGSSQYTAM